MKNNINPLNYAIFQKKPNESFPIRFFFFFFNPIRFLALDISAEGNSAVQVKMSKEYLSQR